MHFRAGDIQAIGAPLPPSARNAIEGTIWGIPLNGFSPSLELDFQIPSKLVEGSTLSGPYAFSLSVLVLNHPINNPTPNFLTLSSAFSGMPLRTCIFAQAISRQLVHPDTPHPSKYHRKHDLGNSVKWIFTLSLIGFPNPIKTCRRFYDRLLRTRRWNAQSAERSNEHAHILV
ncbi:hypothetical protein CEXT_69721 [Caerostris extrusa]|uniref:Uncharacterized protein n=1 Tax=Caerostris extrusa TaxID=172846 RepID=A0AAV4R6F4_CAEEX|nr:hypothetical protein CEXT_69721 [Caerostris extrusa]